MVHGRVPRYAVKRISVEELRMWNPAIGRYCCARQLKDTVDKRGGFKYWRAWALPRNRDCGAADEFVAPESPFRRSTKPP